MVKIRKIIFALFLIGSGQCLAQSFVDDIEFPILPGRQGEMNDLMHSIHFFSNNQQQVSETLIPRADFRGCYNQYYHETLSNFFDSVRTASRVQSQRCANRLEENASIEVNHQFSQTCGRHTFNEHQVNYRLEKQDGKIHLWANLDAKLDCSNCANENGPRFQEVSEYANRCIRKTEEFFNRYDIVLHLNFVIRPFGERLIRDGQEVTVYSMDNSTYQITDDASVFRPDWSYWSIYGVQRRYNHEVRDWVDNVDEKCKYFTRSILLYLGLDSEDHQFGYFNDQQCPSSLSRRAENPYSATDKYLGSVDWDNMDLYPRQIRRLLNPLCGGSSL